MQHDLRDKITTIITDHDEADIDEWRKSEKTVDALVDLIRTHTASLKPLPLVWESTEDGKFVSGIYRVKRNLGGWVASCFESEGYQEYLTGLVSLEDAKEAAQADHIFKWRTSGDL